MHLDGAADAADAAAADVPTDAIFEKDTEHGMTLSGHHYLILILNHNQYRFIDVVHIVLVLNFHNKLFITTCEFMSHHRHQ